MHGMELCGGGSLAFAKVRCRPWIVKPEGRSDFRALRVIFKH